MGRRIGLVAGAGALPLLALEEAGRRGLAGVVAAIRGAADPALESRAEAWGWFGAGELERLAAFFRDHGASEILMVGKVEARRAFDREGRDDGTARLLASLPDRAPATLVAAAIGFLESRGLKVLDPGFLYQPFLLPPGPVTRIAPSPAAEADIALGWDLARVLADRDAGQAVVVKGGAVAAIEAMEGTDETVLRAGRLAGPGAVLVKVARTRQDPRIDVPAAGLETVRALVRIRAAALCLEAGRVLFLQKDEAAAVAESNGLAIVARA